MSRVFLHEHNDFGSLLRIVADEKKIDPYLVEKDYWIMHCLYGLQKMGLGFELKGGTSLSKGYGIISRFSEDIDIRIQPPTDLKVNTNPKSTSSGQIASRKNFYDWLANKINIDGIDVVERDYAFDDERYYRSGGIRLQYNVQTESLAGIKAGVLLEAGFDTVTPNIPKTISSWAYDFAGERIEIVDNRAIEVDCYHCGYTFVEKLQTISTKFRKQQEEGSFPINFMRHYYDAYCLLAVQDVKDFIGTQDYYYHKMRRFPRSDNQDLSKNEAFILSDLATFDSYAGAYKSSESLYYRKQPSFEELIERLRVAIREGKI
ncbi:MAG: nucleotidyl transferase AbiEii/AbiGii toxin family protein [Arenicella sp.]|nr:nucleotidyl transferase AbiEii/AbiGii toxin family protein [Arenicella sp.]